jgi:hypothetical protein
VVAYWAARDWHTIHFEGKREVGQLVVQKESSDHDPISKRTFDRGGHGQGVAVTIDD